MSPCQFFVSSNCSGHPIEGKFYSVVLSSFRELKIDLKYVLANSVNKNLTQITRLGCKKFYCELTFYYLGD